MQPTSRALDIADPIAQAMQQIASTEQAVFAPASAKRTFRAALVNYAAAHLLPAVMDRLDHEAPGVRVLTYYLSSHEADDQVQKGEVDLIIGVVPQGGVHQRVTLFRDELVVIACKRTTRFGKELAIKDLSVASHVYLPQLPGIARVAGTLGTLPHSIFSPANVSFIPFNVMRSNRIALVPKSAAAIFQPYFDLVILRSPWEFAPYLVEMLWHPRLAKDLGHGWMRNAICRTAVELKGKYYSSLRRVRARRNNNAEGS
jgi:LysR family transcriptional activator of mexEF-oprN operon